MDDLSEHEIRPGQPPIDLVDIAVRDRSLYLARSDLFAGRILEHIANLVRDTALAAYIGKHIDAALCTGSEGVIAACDDRDDVVRVKERFRKLLSLNCKKNSVRRRAKDLSDAEMRHPIDAFLKCEDGLAVCAENGMRIAVERERGDLCGARRGKIASAIHHPFMAVVEAIEKAKTEHDGFRRPVVPGVYIASKKSLHINHKA